MGSQKTERVVSMDKNNMQNIGKVTRKWKIYLHNNERLVIPKTRYEEDLIWI